MLDPFVQKSRILCEVRPNSALPQVTVSKWSMGSLSGEIPEIE